VVFNVRKHLTGYIKLKYVLYIYVCVCVCARARARAYVRAFRDKH
jgi:hypothetical protein